ncbi:nitrate- and nitrite sensing domain-containing protein [Actinoplanes sp. GCM10030250]|uniref:nitrate- and nitrite sensing domain-containing protein n=1 Tax=Actinoplanes sp. GCM10030250 TaxID=3273376 RepID=UPI00360E9194
MRSRNWSIRSKIIAMVAVPLSALLALWIFATVVTSGPALTLLSARDAVHRLGDPGLQLIMQLQRERHFAAAYIAARRSTLDDLNKQRAATDEAVSGFRSAAGTTDMNESVRADVAALESHLSELATVRSRIDVRDMDVLSQIKYFNDAIDAGFDVSRTAAVFFHERVDKEVRGVISAFRGQEYLSRADALMAGAAAAGRIDAVSRANLVEYLSTSRYLLGAGVADMPVPVQGDFAKLLMSTTFLELTHMQNILIGDNYVGGPTPISGSQWQPVYDKATQDLTAFELRAVEQIAQDATPLAISVLLRLAVAGLLGLVALVLSIMVSVRFGRSIVGRLVRLRREALEMATDRLPSVVGRLQRGEAVDVEAETPPLEYGGDEIGQLGRAFNNVRRTAVQSAVDEANVRRGINEVFLNIARRSQTLLHRQLSLLDRMERRETEPQELEDLYRVDHLATRMRRHAEDLVILAGAAPGRGWRNPVPVIDVIRGAISEVEDYKRVDIRSVTSSALVGRSVGDVIHLLAELIENAASFSPPHTRVQVVGQVLPNGYAIEIEDRGLGMSPEQIEESNRRLAEPPEFDPTDSARLGLFVVAQLANRHGIRVSLRVSGYGGVTAIVLVPGDLVTVGPGPAAPAGSGGGSGAKESAWGTDDPDPRSLAGMQWQGVEELQQLTVAGRLPGSETQPAAIPQQRVDSDSSGPAPSAVAAELSAEGLVQRRRTRRNSEPQVADVTALSNGAPHGAGSNGAGSNGASNGAANGATLERSGVLAPLDEMPMAPRSVPRNSAPAAPAPVAPVSAAPAFGATEPLAGDGADEDTAALENLPKRVRQANLAPQLRKPVVQPESTAPERSPEQVRTLMSALQLGTTRGRIDASRVTPPADQAPAGPVPVTPETPGSEPAAEPDATAFDEAATVTFPALVDVAAAREKAVSGTDAGASGDRAAGTGENLRLEKDA